MLKQLKKVSWSDIAVPEYLELLNHKTKDEAQVNFDLDIQAGNFNITKIEMRDYLRDYLKNNAYRLKLNRHAKLQKLKLWMNSKRFRIDESISFEKFIVNPTSFHISHDKTEVTFQCVTGDIVTKNAIIEIDPSLEDRVEVKYYIPKCSYNFVSYWSQEKKLKIERYVPEKMHGIRLRISSTECKTKGG